MNNDEFRAEVAAKILTSLTSDKSLIEQVEDQITDSTVYDHLAKQSVLFADALLKELKK